MVKTGKLTCSAVKKSIGHEEMKVGGLLSTITNQTRHASCWWTMTSVAMWLSPFHGSEKQITYINQMVFSLTSCHTRVYSYRLYTSTTYCRIWTGAEGKRITSFTRSWNCSHFTLKDSLTDSKLLACQLSDVKWCCIAHRRLKRFAAGKRNGLCSYSSWFLFRLKLGAHLSNIMELAKYIHIERPGKGRRPEDCSSTH